MQIVIDMSEEQYKRICNHTDGIYDMTSLLTIVENGTPLPKGHGDLIDGRSLACAIMKTPYSEGIKYLRMVESMPTIIEADKAESEE